MAGGCANISASRDSRDRCGDKVWFNYKSSLLADSSAALGGVVGFYADGYSSKSVVTADDGWRRFQTQADSLLRRVIEHNVEFIKTFAYKYKI